MKRWEAWAGTEVVEGKLANGKTRRTLVTVIIVAHTKSDAKMIERARPEVRFVERDDERGAASRSGRRK